MMTHWPVTVKRSVELLGLCLAGLIIITGSHILMPLLLAFFLSIVLLPVYRFLTKIRFPEVLAITLALLLLMIITGGILWFVSSQFTSLIDDFPAIQKNVLMHLERLGDWVTRQTNFSAENQVQFVKDQSAKLLNSTGAILGTAASSVSSMLIFFGLIPIYIFLILFYKNLLLRFVVLWFPETAHPQLREVLTETEAMVKSYLVGLLIQITYITVLLGGTLMLFGIKHALLIGIMFGILNLIPYVGALIGNILGVLLTLTSSQELWPVLTVLITIAVVQFLDNNILMPRIVGSKVKINALVSIIGVVIGGSLAGIAGMFLSMPVIAVLKIIFDRTTQFKQWGVLFGEEKPRINPLLKLRKKS